MNSKVSIAKPKNFMCIIIIILLQEQRSQPPRELKVMKYSDGKSLAVLLHDSTGHV